MRRKIYMGLGIAFVVMMIGCTLYSRYFYQNSLPLVNIILPHGQSFSFELSRRGFVEDGAATGSEYPFTVTVAFKYDELGFEGRHFLWQSGDDALLLFPEFAKDASLQGKIDDIKFMDEEIVVRVGFIYDSNSLIKLGASATVELAKVTAMFNTVLPVSAIYSDSAGDYIYQVYERGSAWGSEYALVKTYVSVYISDGENVAVISGVSAKQPIVSGSSKLLRDGIVVRFYP